MEVYQKKLNEWQISLKGRERGGNLRGEHAIDFFNKRERGFGDSRENESEKTSSRDSDNHSRTGEIQ